MATGGFAVANPQPIDLGSGLTNAGNNLVQIASILEQRRLRQENEKTTALLGIAQSDVGVYNPEGIDAVSAAGNQQDRTTEMMKSIQTAIVRKQQHRDLIGMAKAFEDAKAAGIDPTPILIAHQQALTSSGLPKNLIAAEQARLGSAATKAEAVIGAETRKRGLVQGDQAEQRAYNESTQLAQEGRQESRQLAAEGRQNKQQLAFEARAAERDDLEARRRYSVAAGVPWNSTNPPTWGEVNSGVIYAAENAGKPQPKEIRAANRGIAQRVTTENKTTKRSGEVTDVSVMGRARDLNTEAASTGSDLVVIPVVTSEAGFTNWGEDVRLEALPWQEARVELARVYQIANQEGPGSESAKYISHIVALASTTDSPALKAMLEQKVSPQEKEAIAKTMAARWAKPGESFNPEETGRKIGKSLREGFTNTPERKARVDKLRAEQEKLDEKLRKTPIVPRGLQLGAKGLVEGLTGRDR